MDRIEEKHKLVEEMLEVVSDYIKKAKIPIWFNLEDAYRLETEVPVENLREIKNRFFNQLTSISNYSYGGLKPKYKLELKTDNKGKIISYDIVEDLPECCSYENGLPPKRINDLIRILPEMDDIILPTHEEIKEEFLEIEWKKLQSTIGLQEDAEEV
ncbi:MAG: hypothetical protein QXP77_02325 [Candidatus Aenigmatarchaeota archaeon]